MDESPEEFDGLKHDRRYQDEDHATVDEYKIDPQPQPEP
jgi:hypothetical protein